MLTHFQYKPLYEHADIPGWRFSFYYMRQRHSGIYHPEGRIEWTSGFPAAKSILEAQIHDLMLFHVYDK
ncbi:YheE family protein [Mesobacillus foraminis]|uniref:YheE family protein n=1 Tax=Mesobacillus foraminis TaxID=279826 RepID=UPI001BE515CE|nr:YheE family protein [Mesobacillus foraminis]MBT2759436.1 YheE family protein [Mesobacillus foraminis]